MAPKLVVALICGVLGAQSALAADQVQSPGKSAQPTQQVVQLGAFSLQADSRDLLTVRRDGKIIQDKRTIGRIKSSGAFFDRKGVEVAKLQSDGMLVDGEGKNLLKIDAEGNLDNGSGVAIGWSPIGELLRDQTPIGIRLAPPNSPHRRLASAVAFLYFSIQPPVVTEVPRK